MIGVWNRSRRPATLAAFVAALSVTGRARADVAVTIRHESADQLEIARRIASELSTEGYAVEVVQSVEPTPCDAEGARLVTAAPRTNVWIRLISNPSSDGSVLASICYLGTLSLLQRASVSAPSGEPRELALATAEALNGLRSQLPPAPSGPEQATPSAGERSSAPEQPAEPSFDAVTSSVVVGTAVAFNLPDFPTAPGIVGRATLGVASSAGITFDAFIPTTGSELSSSAVNATVRTSWLRVGPRFGIAAGDFDFSAAPLAGPTVTWASGEARPPRVGTTDVTTGAVLSLAVFVEYPRNAAVFACASASASALLPGVRVDLADGAAPEGSWPLEASIGFGVRWGRAR